MTDAPPFSILIATRDRADRLGACLDRLIALGGEAQREFILIDNGSTDATADILFQFQRACPWPVVLLWEPRAGSGWALNRGLAHARAEILIFTDDDCYADPGLIAAYARTFADPQVGYAGGRILLHDPDDARLSIRECTAAERFAPGGFVAPGRIQGANMAFRRKTLLQIGGFDPNFGAGARFSGVDVDACGRASAAGWHGAYVPAAMVRHHHRRRGSEARRLGRRYAVGGGAYCAKQLIESPRRLRDAIAILRFISAPKSPLAILRQLFGSAQYAALRLAGRLYDARSPFSAADGGQAEAMACPPGR